VRIELQEGKAASDIEELFKQVINTTRALWIRLPNDKRWLYQGEKYMPVLELHAATSSGILDGTITPSAPGDSTQELICNLATQSGSLKGFPRTETCRQVDGRDVWVTKYH
jgi:hypothetical protein